jgi:holo-[acyl-carrier protein] synthase
VILGIGVDVVDIARFIQTSQSSRFKLKYFSPSEQSLPAQSLAGHFAAREAFYKALDQQSLFHKDNLEVSNDRSGKPRFIFSGELEKYSQGKNIYLSISHCVEYAVAMVVIENKAIKNV